MLLGNLWNRTPTTQLYDDLGPGRGYTPTFPLPGIAEAPRRVQRPGFRIARLSRASRVTLRERDQPRAIHACGSMLLGDAHKRQALHISSSSGVGGRRVARRPRGAKAFQDPANPRAGDPQERRSGSAAPDCSVGLLAAVSTRVTGAGETAPTERFRQSAGRGCPASAGLLLPFQTPAVSTAQILPPNAVGSSPEGEVSRKGRRSDDLSGAIMCRLPGSVRSFASPSGCRSSCLATGRRTSSTARRFALVPWASSMHRSRIRHFPMGGSYGSC